MAALSLSPLPARSAALLPSQSYLARLSPSSRPTMRGSLRALAELLGATGHDEVAWSGLGYPVEQRLIACTTISD